MTLPAETHIGRVQLTVSDLERSLHYYENHIGLIRHHVEGSTAVLGVEGTELLLLTEVPGAQYFQGRSGLYHYAILLPDRVSLSRTLHHLMQIETPISGASDHIVSEALYLSDPDGNGIEIYRDRARKDWYDQDGQFQLATLQLDVRDLLNEASPPNGNWSGMPSGTVIGHVHLHIPQLDEAQMFYVEQLGFDLMMRYGNTASFISAGGYHHHLGINTWAGVGAPPNPPDAVGIRWYEVVLPDQGALDDLTENLTKKGVAYDEAEDGIAVRDPGENMITFVVKGSE